MKLCLLLLPVWTATVAAFTIYERNCQDCRLKMRLHDENEVPRAPIKRCSPFRRSPRRARIDDYRRRAWSERSGDRVTIIIERTVTKTVERTVTAALRESVTAGTLAKYTTSVGTVNRMLGTTSVLLARTLTPEAANNIPPLLPKPIPTTIVTTVVERKTSTAPSVKLETTTVIAAITSAVVSTAYETAFATQVITTPLPCPPPQTIYIGSTVHITFPSCGSAGQTSVNSSTPTSRPVSVQPTSSYLTSPTDRQTSTDSTLSSLVDSTSRTSITAVIYTSASSYSSKSSATMTFTTIAVVSQSLGSSLQSSTATIKPEPSLPSSDQGDDDNNNNNNEDDEDDENDSWPPVITFKFASADEQCYNPTNDITLCNHALVDETIADIVVPNHVLSALSDFVDGAIFVEPNGTKFIVVSCHDEFGTIKLTIYGRDYSFPSDSYLTKLEDKRQACRLRFISYPKDKLAPQVWQLGAFFIQSYPEVAKLMINEEATRRLKNHQNLIKMA